MVQFVIDRAWPDKTYYWKLESLTAGIGVLASGQERFSSIDEARASLKSLKVDIFHATVQVAYAAAYGK